MGCGQNVFVKDEKVVQIEGDPDSPVSRGRLCPKGSASLQLTTGGSREYKVKYRRPFGTEFEDLDLDTAMDMIADRCWPPAVMAGSGRWTGTGPGGPSGSPAPPCRLRAGGRVAAGASALTRYGVFEAGLASARDPKYTIVPQRARR